MLSSASCSTPSAGASDGVYGLHVQQRSAVAYAPQTAHAMPHTYARLQKCGDLAIPCDPVRSHDLLSNICYFWTYSPSSLGLPRLTPP